MEGCVRRAGMLALFGVLAAASSAGAQGQGGRNAAPQPAGAGQAAMALKSIDPDGRRMEQLLQLWSRTSTELKTLEVKITKVDDINPAWGKPETFEGRAFFKEPNLAWLDFKKVVLNPNKEKTLVDDERMICTGNEVWQYRSPTKQIFIYPLDRKNRQKALQEGPLPFLFNFKENEAKTRYEMVLALEKNGKYVVRVTPREQVDKECFSMAYITLAYLKLERQAAQPKLLPTQILLYPPEPGKGRRLYSLTDLKPNVDVAMANFKGTRLGPPWTIHFNPVDDKPVADPRGRAGAGAPAVSNRAAQRRPR